MKPRTLAFALLILVGCSHSATPAPPLKPGWVTWEFQVKGAAPYRADLPSDWTAIEKSAPNVSTSTEFQNGKDERLYVSYTPGFQKDAAELYGMGPEPDRHGSEVNGETQMVTDGIWHGWITDSSISHSPIHIHNLSMILTDGKGYKFVLYTIKGDSALTVDDVKTICHSLRPD